MAKEEKKQVIGECLFCGQQQVLELPESEWLTAIEATGKSGKDLADEFATEKCKCKEGEAWRWERYVLNECGENINIMFLQDYPEIAAVFQEAKKHVWTGHAKRISIATPTGGVASMQKKENNIEIKFVQKNETKITVTGG